jgi:hypothetical protein
MPVMQNLGAQPVDAAVVEVVEGDPSAERATNRPADRALVGCLYLVGAVAVAAFFYFGFFVFAVLDDRNQWGLLEPYLDERTSEILYILYWPLIHFYLWLGWQ